jgi:cobalamin biosynthesis Mg chelatase CobN
VKRHPGVVAIIALTVVLLTLAACDVVAGTPSISTSSEGLLLPMSTETSSPVSCEGCPQATLAALQTQEKSSSDAQAAATAEIMRANAQATLNAVNSTVSAAQTQEKNNANVIAAQVASTAAIVRANAQATLVAAGSTQSAALTQDAIRQTQVQYSLQVTADVATQNAIATLNQQNNNFLAASTQAAVANHIATQTQSAVSTSQWYADQARQREEQRQAPLTFLWLWCPPLFIVSIVLICLLFFWRWMKIRETQQRIDMQPEAPIIIEHEPRQIIDVTNNEYQPKPTDHVRRWLDEAKRKLITDKKDDDDNPGS